MSRLLLFSLSLAFIACGDVPPATESVASRHEAERNQNMTLPESDTSFPQLSPSEEEEPFPDALISGTLVLEGGCLRLNPSEGGPSYLIVWPSHVTFDTQGDLLRVVDHDNQIAAVPGEQIVLAGGEVDRSSQIMSQLQQPLPSNCQGPLWLAKSLAPSR